MFIPNENRIKIGDRVELLQDVKFHHGIFTEGHQFTVSNESNRGYDLVDDDGRWILECGPFITLKKIKSK